jgi:K+-transporting ATPase ATPase C chain
MGKQVWAGIRLMLVFTVLLGLVYPLAGVAAGRLLPGRADGSLVGSQGQVVGSALLGQEFTGERWFVGRPSVSDYDAMASGGSNLGPNNQDLVDGIAARRALVAAREGVPEAAVPPDAVTASASGLDPEISVAYALLQAPRVARANGLSETQVRQMVADATRVPTPEFLGVESVNVLALNLALHQAQ